MSKLAHSSDYMDEIERRDREDIAGPIESGDLMLCRQILHIRGITFETADLLAKRVLLAGFHRAPAVSESPTPDNDQRTRYAE